MALIKLETRTGEAIRAGKAKIVPFTKTLLFKLPGLPGVFFWSKPSKVLVQEEGGQEKSLPVVDATRRRQLAIAATGLAGSLVLATVIKFRK